MDLCFFVFQEAEAWVLFLVLSWSAAVGDDALLRVFIFPGGPIYFPCLAGRNSLPVALGNWLARALICFTLFGRLAEKIDEIRGAQGKTGNLFSAMSNAILAIIDSPSRT